MHLEHGGHRVSCARRGGGPLILPPTTKPPFRRGPTGLLPSPERDGTIVTAAEARGVSTNPSSACCDAEPLGCASARVGRGLGLMLRGRVSSTGKGEFGGEPTGESWGRKDLYSRGLGLGGLSAWLSTSNSITESEWLCEDVPGGIPIIPVGRREAAEFDGRSLRTGARAVAFELASASRLLVGGSGRGASRSINAREARAGDRALIVDGVGVVEPLTGSVVLFVITVGFDLFSPFPPVEAPLLPLRVLFMYSAMASASRSRMRDVIAEGTTAPPVPSEVEPFDDGLGRAGILPLDDDGVGCEDPDDIEGGKGPFGGGTGGDGWNEVDPSASDVVVRLPDDPLRRRTSSSFVSLMPLLGSSSEYPSRAARSPARAAA